MRFLLSVLCFLVFTGSVAQQNHFVYIQTDNRQPFYVKLGGKVLSSSSSGYIILSKLKEGDLGFSIGFTGNDIPEQKFVLKNFKNDLGLSLKNFNEKGWGLFNLETLEIIYANTPTVLKPGQAKHTDQKQDAFTDMLAQVTGDSSIKENVKKKEEKPAEKNVVENPVAKSEPLPEKKAGIDKPIQGVKKETITRATEFVNSELYNAIYFIEKDGQRDTVDISISIDKVNERKKDSTPANKSVKFLDIEVDPKASDNKISKKDTISVKPVSAAAVDTSRNVTMVPASSPATKSKRINPDCGTVASDDDFKKLRKKMAAQSSDDDMIYEARKAFRLKCYSSEQVKNLGSLFLTDASRYSFFDAAYLRVYDPDEFPSLVDQLKTEYYINRFKAMIR